MRKLFIILIGILILAGVVYSKAKAENKDRVFSVDSESIYRSKLHPFKTPKTKGYLGEIPKDFGDLISVEKIKGEEVYLWLQNEQGVIRRVKFAFKDDEYSIDFSNIIRFDRN